LQNEKPIEDTDMSDMIDSPNEGENAPEFTVSELSGVLKRMIEC
jgi:exodeoxyribonuclease VII large subunit